MPCVQLPAYPIARASALHRPWRRHTVRAAFAYAVAARAPLSSTSISATVQALGRVLRRQTCARRRSRRPAGARARGVRRARRLAEPGRRGCQPARQHRPRARGGRAAARRGRARRAWSRGRPAHARSCAAARHMGHMGWAGAGGWSAARKRGGPARRRQGLWRRASDTGRPARRERRGPAAAAGGARLRGAGRRAGMQRGERAASPRGPRCGRGTGRPAGWPQPGRPAGACGRGRLGRRGRRRGGRRGPGRAARLPGQPGGAARLPCPHGGRPCHGPVAPASSRPCAMLGLASVTRNLSGTRGSCLHKCSGPQEALPLRGPCCMAAVCMFMYRSCLLSHAAFAALTFHGSMGTADAQPGRSKGTLLFFSVYLVPNCVMLVISCGRASC